MKQIHELLKGSITVLVLTGAMLATPMAHSQQIAYVNEQIDTATINQYSPTSNGNFDTIGYCTLDGVRSWGVLRYQAGAGASWKEVRFKGSGANVKLRNLRFSGDRMVRMQVLCDYRHERNPIATAMLIFY
ncbi:MAG: hypothetical protein V4673_13680 [Pseudomonadota bacterium]